MYSCQDVRRGLNSIRRICREYKINGVYGPIIELLDCDEKLFTAVEVTAGNRFVLCFTCLIIECLFIIYLVSKRMQLFTGFVCFLCWNCVFLLWILSSLFHVVVESDEISTQIIRHLNALKGGRVTFIPLNRVKAPRVLYPKSNDVIPLLEKLKFSPNFRPAFAQVSFFLTFHILVGFELSMNLVLL